MTKKIRWTQKGANALYNASEGLLITIAKMEKKNQALKDRVEFLEAILLGRKWNYKKANENKQIEKNLRA